VTVAILHVLLSTVLSWYFALKVLFFCEEEEEEEEEK
jgi:hypothetical protein